MPRVVEQGAREEQLEAEAVAVEVDHPVDGDFEAIEELDLRAGDRR